MSLKSCFMRAINPLVRFLDQQEIRLLENRRDAAKAGVYLIRTRSDVACMHLEPEAAKAIAANYDRDIVKLKNKHNLVP